MAASCCISSPCVLTHEDKHAWKRPRSGLNYYNSWSLPRHHITVCLCALNANAQLLWKWLWVHIENLIEKSKQNKYNYEINLCLFCKHAINLVLKPFPCSVIKLSAKGRLHLAIDSPVQSIVSISIEKIQRQLLYAAMKCHQPITKNNVVTEDEWLHI